MPYELTFAKLVKASISEEYINDCCYGGDFVAEQLLPALKERYPDCQCAGQEDWGWFIWFRDGGVFLSVDIFCDDPVTGAFRVHLTARRKRWLRPSSIVDSPALENLKAIVVERLAKWIGAPPGVALVEAKYRSRDNP